MPTIQPDEELTPENLEPFRMQLEKTGKSAQEIKIRSIDRILRGLIQHFPPDGVTKS